MWYEQKSGTQGDSRLLLNRRTATGNLFVLYNKETNYNRFLFQNLSSSYSIADLGPLWRTRKKPFAVICYLRSPPGYLYKMKQSMRSKELWLVQENHATVKLYSNGFTWNENLQRKHRSAKRNIGLWHFDVICDLLLNRRTERWNLIC